MTDKLQQVLDTPGCERLRDFAAVGPAQRAALELFVDRIRAGIGGSMITADDYAAIRVALECFQSDCKSAVEYASKLYEYASKLYEGRDDLKNRIDREQFMLDHATAALTALEKYKPKE